MLPSFNIVAHRIQLQLCHTAVQRPNPKQIPQNLRQQTFTRKFLPVADGFKHVHLHADQTPWRKHTGWVGRFWSNFSTPVRPFPDHAKRNIRHTESTDTDEHIKRTAAPLLFVVEEGRRWQRDGCLRWLQGKTGTKKTAFSGRTRWESGQGDWLL